MQYQNLSFPSCSKQFSSFADCFIAPALHPINKRLLSHDSDKWKAPLHPYEIVYPQKILTWRYEKLGCPGMYHIPLVKCSFELEKIALEATLVSSYHSGPQCWCLCFHCLHQEVKQLHPQRVLCGPSITHLFPGLLCSPRWQQARSPPWCRNAGRTDTCSQVLNHGRSIWWYWGCWCRPSVLALPLCHWLDAKMIRKS